MLTATLATLAIVTVTGCGTATSLDQGAGGTRPPALTGSPSPDPLRPQSPPPEAPQPLPTAEPSQPGRSLVSLPWQFGKVTRNGHRVYLSYVTSGCYSAGYVAVHETQDDVVVTAWSQRINGNARCPMYARITYGWVTLDAPLGDRALLHAPVTDHS